MELRYITCSDPRENLNPNDVIDLLKTSPLAELGVQAHFSAMSFGLARFDWLKQLLDIAQKSETPVNIALHVNYEWCDKICTGKIPGEIKYFLKRKNSLTNKPLISRIQLNIGDGTRNFSSEKLSNIICGMQNYEFIFPFNSLTKRMLGWIPQNVKFNCLFDESYGIGKSPESWKKPYYEHRQFGYAGGISPQNVCENLDKISKILPQNYKTWIDAEGQLRDASGGMNLDSARDYLTNALTWYNQHNK